MQNLVRSYNVLVNNKHFQLQFPNSKITGFALGMYFLLQSYILEIL